MLRFTYDPHVAVAFGFSPRLPGYRVTHIRVERVLHTHALPRYRFTFARTFYVPRLPLHAVTTPFTVLACHLPAAGYTRYTYTVAFGSRFHTLPDCRFARLSLFAIPWLLPFGYFARIIYAALVELPHALRGCPHYTLHTHTPPHTHHTPLPVHAHWLLRIAVPRTVYAVTDSSLRGCRGSLLPVPLPYVAAIHLSGLHGSVTTTGLRIHRRACSSLFRCVLLDCALILRYAFTLRTFALRLLLRTDALLRLRSLFLSFRSRLPLRYALPHVARCVAIVVRSLRYVTHALRCCYVALLLPHVCCYVVYVVVVLRLRCVHADLSGSRRFAFTRLLQFLLVSQISLLISLSFLRCLATFTFTTLRFSLRWIAHCPCRFTRVYLVTAHVYVWISFRLVLDFTFLSGILPTLRIHLSLPVAHVLHRVLLRCLRDLSPL